MGSQPGRQFAPGQLCLSLRSVAEGKMMRVMMEWEEHRGQCSRFPGICLTTEENLRLETVQGHTVVRLIIASNGVPFLQNEVSRVMLPATLAKPIWVWPEERAKKKKKMRSRIQRSRDLCSAPTSHS